MAADIIYLQTYIYFVSFVKQQLDLLKGPFHSHGKYFCPRSVRSETQGARPFNAQTNNHWEKLQHVSLLGLYFPLC